MTPRLPQTRRAPQNPRPRANNPFLNLNADRYTVDLAVDYFEPTTSWYEVKLPENQLVFGSYGSGKSMLLRRLQASAMGRQPLFADTAPFLGVYVNLLLDVSFMDAVARLAGNSTVLGKWPDAKDRALATTERFLALTVACAALQEIEEASRRPFFGELRRENDLVRLLKQLFGINDTSVRSASLLGHILKQRREDIRAACASVAIFGSDHSDPMRQPQLPLVADTLAALTSEMGFFASYSSTLPVFLLFDQLESVSAEAQALLTPLMRRGNSYYTKCAARMYGWQPDSRIATNLSVDDDFFPLFVGSADDQYDEYERVARKVAEAMLRTNSTPVALDSLLPSQVKGKRKGSYAGAEELLKLASGSVRLFLELCSQVVICAESKRVDWTTDAVPPDCQATAAKVWAKRSLERIETSDKVLGAPVRSFVESLCRDRRKDGAALAQTFKVGEDLFGLEALTEKQFAVIRAAFAFDAVRVVEAEDASLFDVPDRFSLAMIVLAAFGLPTERKGHTRIQANELSDRFSPIRSHPGTEETPRARPSMFLSTSFGRTPLTTEQRKAISRTFKGSFELIAGDELAGGQLLLRKILEAIRSVDVVVVELSEPTPSVMLELGMSYALSKRVFALFNQENPASAAALKNDIRVLDLVPYTLDTESLVRARDRILSRYNGPTLPGETMEENVFGISLRPSSNRRGLFLYHPEGRTVWKVAEHRLQDALDALGIDLVSLNAAPECTRLEQVMYCVSLAASSSAQRLGCVIDTTGAESPDLAGCFAIGAAVALKKATIRIEEAGATHQGALALFTDPFLDWHSVDDLVSELRMRLKREGGDE